MDKGFVSSIQIFPTCEMEETTAFYENIGFRAVKYLASIEPHVCLYRDDVEIVLTQSLRSSIEPNHLLHGYGYDAYFISNNQAEIQAELKSKGVKIVRELNTTDYFNFEFVFEDNEGRWIAVGRKNN